MEIGLGLETRCATKSSMRRYPIVTCTCPYLQQSPSHLVPLSRVQPYLKKLRPSTSTNLVSLASLDRAVPRDTLNCCPGVTPQEISSLNKLCPPSFLNAETERVLCLAPLNHFLPSCMQDEALRYPCLLSNWSWNSDQSSVSIAAPELDGSCMFLP